MTKPTYRTCGKNDLILVAGGGGFIGGSLVRYLTAKGFTRIRAVDRKPLPEWYQRTPGVECLSLDLSQEKNCRRAVEGAAEVYNLAADMGGMGFIERFRIMCLRSILINTHLIEAAYRAGVQRYFYSSSACAYNTTLQKDPHARALKESDAYPAMAERGLHTAIARFHNVYGPWGTWDGGREKAPAAICRKVIEAKDRGTGVIEVWGDGTQSRSYMLIDDCVSGIDRIMHCDELRATPINLGSSELITVDELVSLAEAIGGVKLKRKYNLAAPKGVAGRNSDNTMIKRMLGWEPSIPFRVGLKKTYRWIEQQYFARKSGRPTVRDLG